MNPDLSNNIKMLNQLDQQIDAYNQQIKGLLLQKAQISKQVVGQLKDNKLENSVIKTSKRHYKIVKRKKRQAFNKSYLTEQLTEFLGDPDRATNLVALLYENRKTTITESLSSTKPKSSGD